MGRDAKVRRVVKSAHCLVVLLLLLLQAQWYTGAATGMVSGRITYSGKEGPETIGLNRVGPASEGVWTASLQFSKEREDNLFAGLAGAGTGPGQLMALSEDKTHLMNTFTNKPVFITGEAAWSLIAQPSDSDVDTYLSDRASRGFNAIIVNLRGFVRSCCAQCERGD